MDKDAKTATTKAPAVQRFSLRLMLSRTVFLDNLSCHTRDITQAYAQSVTSLKQEMYFCPTIEMGIPVGKVLKVVKLPYSILESGLHWYLSYMKHHMRKLRMSRSRTEPCILWKKGEEGLDGMVIIQVDDSLIACTQKFLNDDDSESISFLSKPRQCVSENPALLNGLEISCQGSGEISIRQQIKIKAPTVPTTEKGFKSQRTLVQCLGVSCRPDV